MAVSTGGQPKAEAQRPKAEHASADARDAAEKGSAQPRASHVAMVSRDHNGDPAESKNFVVLVDDGASDEEKDAAWNKAGEAMGAANFKEPKPRDAEQEAKDEEQRAQTESDELRRINKHSFGD
jgi:hypothetical protein